MANICTQVAVIACKDNESALELTRTMAENAGFPVNEKTKDASQAFKGLASTMQAKNRNLLGLFCQGDPDTGAEGGFAYISKYDGRYVLHIDMALKWSPSTTPDGFCADLDKERYGYVIADGGEWCEWETITLDDEWLSPEDYDELCEQESEVPIKDVTGDLHALARHHLLTHYTSEEF